MNATKMRAIAYEYNTKHKPLIPECVFEQISLCANRGEFSTAFYPSSDFDVKCVLNSDAPIQHAKIKQITAQLQAEGYGIIFNYLCKDPKKPIDSIEVYW